MNMRLGEPVWDTSMPEEFLSELLSGRSMQITEDASFLLDHDEDSYIDPEIRVGELAAWKAQDMAALEALGLLPLQLESPPRNEDYSWPLILVAGVLRPVFRWVHTPRGTIALWSQDIDLSPTAFTSKFHCQLLLAG